MGLAIVALIVLAIFTLVAVPIVARTISVASSRNEKQPGGGEQGGSAEGQPTDQEIKDEAEVIKRAGPLVGAVMGISGLLSGLAGGIFGLDGGLVGSAIPAASMGIFLGLVGYVLGARLLGRAAAIFSVVAIIFAMSASQGYVPGLPATDRGLPAQELSSE